MGYLDPIDRSANTFEDMHALFHQYFSEQGRELISSGIVKNERDQLLGIRFENGVESEDARNSEKARAAYKFLMERAAGQLPSLGLKAATLVIDGLQYSVTLVGGVLTFNPITAPIGLAVGAAINSARAFNSERSFDDKLKWFYENWNDRRAKLVSLGADSTPLAGTENCQPMGLAVTEWSPNPLLSTELNVNGLNQALRGVKTMRYLTHNAIVDTVCAYCCRRLVKKSEEANSRKKVYGQVTVPLGKFSRYIKKKLPGFSASHSGDVTAVAELLVVHLSQCQCEFSRELLYILVGGKDFGSVYSDIFSRPGEAVARIKEAVS